MSGCLPNMTKHVMFFARFGRREGMFGIIQGQIQIQIRGVLGGGKEELQGPEGNEAEQEKAIN